MWLRSLTAVCYHFTTSAVEMELSGWRCWCVPLVRNYGGLLKFWLQQDISNCYQGEQRLLKPHEEKNKPVTVHAKLGNKLPAVQVLL